MSLVLRPYQERTVLDARWLYRQGKRAILIVMPTGGGKTATMCALVAGAHVKGSRVVWIVHRAELIQQAADALHAIGVPAGIIAPWAEPTRSSVQVCSVQTLLARDQRPPADVLVWDEAHHAVADTYAAVCEHYKTAVRFGLTATPARADGVGLGNLFGSILVAATPRELIASGYLVPAKVFGPPRCLRHLADDPVQAYIRLGEKRQAIVFAASLSHGKQVVEDFRKEGIPAAWVDGETDATVRMLAVQKYRTKRLRVLVNYNVFTEGFDAPETSCIILARGFSSSGAYLQATGRGLRIAPWANKKDCLVLDLKGAALEHGLPDDDRIYSLEGKAISTADNLEPIRQCPQCGGVFRSAEFKDATCPQCGHHTKGRQDPKVKREILARLFASHVNTQRTETLRELLALARNSGKKLGWALIQYKLRYQHWPTEQMKINAGWYEG